MTAVTETTRLSQAAKAGDFWLRGKSCDIQTTLRSDTALVTFDNLASIDERPDQAPWTPWLAARAEALGYSIVGVQSHYKDWYRTPEAPEQIAELQALGFFERFQNIVFTGASMGGFAALCFAGLVPGARVLAFSPQSTLNRDIAPFERRYPYPYRKFDWQSPEYLDAADHVGAIASGHIFYDPRVPQDKQHAERLRTPALEEVRLPFAGHTLIRVIVKAGALEHLLSTYPGTGQVDAGFFRLMRNKRNNLFWAKGFLHAAAKRGDGPLAQRACDIVARDYGHGFAHRVQRRLAAPAIATEVAPEIPQPKESDLSETGLRRATPVFVNSYNQLTYLRDTVDWFARHGFSNVTVIDNKSSYPALLEYFESDDFRAKARVRHLGENLGPRQSLVRAAQDPATDAGFIFTDPDLTLPEPPAPDMLKVMFDVGRRHKFIKVGLALSLDPEIVDLERVTYNTRTVAQVERKYWKRAVEDGVFRATTDTTFFLYVPQEGETRRFNDFGPRQAKIPSVRIGRDGFVAVHRPWLFKDTIDEAEKRYYFDETDAHSTYVVSQKAAQQAAEPEAGASDAAVAETAPDPQPEASAAPDRQLRAAMKAFNLRAFADSCPKPITLVQIGANDGRMADPVFPYLSKGGWQGVRIEPHPLYFSELTALHANQPEFQLFNVAISDEPGQMELFHLNEAARDRYPRGLRGCASLGRDRMEDALRRGSRRRKVQIEDGDIVSTRVEVRRLDAVLAEAGIRQADILVIDVEGHEINVLNSFDLPALGLKMAIVECNGPDAGNETEIARLLGTAGLTVTRFGDDLIGIRDGAIPVPLDAVHNLLGFAEV